MRMMTMRMQTMKENRTIKKKENRNKSKLSLRTN